ncbi:hypothetical protein B0J13DRAFT_608191 [Dactylonectria estremocensis]|uniref:Uncharacterized protein n=1 Tax=Dactylonectria estremocensis TaxID=1079267 RepID=A0A9P9EPF5_9HYPO|nr:hypothetical protein B0J13DRAFT_608191 [Dactylonectria estremocensis]
MNRQCKTQSLDNKRGRTKWHGVDGHVWDPRARGVGRRVGGCCACVAETGALNGDGTWKMGHGRWDMEDGTRKMGHGSDAAARITIGDRRCAPSQRWEHARAGSGKVETREPGPVPTPCPQLHALHECRQQQRRQVPAGAPPWKLQLPSTWPLAGKGAHADGNGVGDHSKGTNTAPGYRARTGNGERGTGGQQTGARGRSQPCPNFFGRPSSALTASVTRTRQ